MFVAEAEAPIALLLPSLLETEDRKVGFALDRAEATDAARRSGTRDETIW